jgi:hypothetical protein
MITVRSIRCNHGVARDKAKWNAYMREYRRSRPHIIERQRDLDFQRRYGITLAEYNAMLEAQGGKCSICRRPERGRSNGGGGGLRRLSVDHEHGNGRVRGLLCMTCNVMVGIFEDCPTVVDAMLAYLGVTD